MGCCIPKRPCISLVTTNKKSTQKVSTNYEKSFLHQNSKDLNKYLSYFELTKYYLPFPILNSEKSLSADSHLNLNSPIQNNNNEKKKKKIKDSMNKLKKLSLLEVNDCKKYFIERKKCLNIK